MPGGFHHPPAGPPCGGRKEYLPLGLYPFVDVQDHPQGGGFSGSGAAGDDAQRAFGPHPHRLRLPLGKGKAERGLGPCKLRFYVRLKVDWFGKHPQHLMGHIRFRLPQLRLVDPLNIAGQLSFRQQLVQPCLHHRERHDLLGKAVIQELVGLLKQFPIGEEQMPGLFRFVQQIAQPAPDPQRVGGAAPDCPGDSVHNLEPKPLDLAQAEGLVLEDVHGVSAEGFPHLCRLFDADPIRGKAGHDVPQRPALQKRGLDGLQLLGGDPPDIQQLAWPVFQHLHRLEPEGFIDGSGCLWPDALDKPGA